MHVRARDKNQRQADKGGGAEWEKERSKAGGRELKVSGYLPQGRDIWSRLVSFVSLHPQEPRNENMEGQRWAQPTILWGSLVCASTFRLRTC